jgi:hypothetical protein
MTRSLSLLVLLTATAFAADGALAQSPHLQLPAAIAASGDTALATYHAEGAQVYECKAGNDGKLAWTFREPIATLLSNGKTVGRHFAGPTWALNDGSSVIAKVAGNAPGGTAQDIPWLKLEVTSHGGNGLLAEVDTVQRLNTRGGVASGTCDQAGAFRSVPYSAEYSFLSKAPQDLTSSVKKPGQAH